MRSCEKFIQYHMITTVRNTFLSRALINFLVLINTIAFIRLADETPWNSV